MKDKLDRLMCPSIVRLGKDIQNVGVWRTKILDFLKLIHKFNFKIYKIITNE